MPPGTLGLIAGEGALPVLGAGQAREQGRRLVCVALHGLADPALETWADEILWMHPGEVMRGIGFLREHGVTEAVLAGKVSKQGLLDGGAPAGQDAEAARLLATLPNLRDATILGKLADVLHAAGIELLPQWSLVPGLRGSAGVQGRVVPDERQRADVAFGLQMARAVAALDIGQTLVVKLGSVLAVEALEGTDAAIARGGTLARDAVVVKVARPSQDPRFDVPAIGPRTVEVAADVGVGCLAYEAGATLLLERGRLVASADAAGIALLGVEPVP